jgi:hypothetical protein
MINAWWLLWMAFMFLFLVSLVTYGWGYPGWGRPYPRYIQRRRGLRASALGQPADLHYQSWGWAATLSGLLAAGPRKPLAALRTRNEDLAHANAH